MLIGARRVAYKVHTWPFDLLKERKAGIVCSPMSSTQVVSRNPIVCAENLAWR